MSEPLNTQCMAYNVQTQFPLQDMILYNGKIPEMDRILPRLIISFNMFKAEKCLYGRVAIFYAIAEHFSSCSNLDDVVNCLEPLLPKLFNMIEYCVENLKILINFILNKKITTDQCAEFYVKKLEMLILVIGTLVDGSTAVCKEFRHRISFFCWALRCSAKFSEMHCIAAEYYKLTKHDVPSEIHRIFTTIDVLSQIILEDMYEDCANVNLITNPKFLLNLSSSIQHACRIVNWKDSNYHAALWHLYINKVISCDVMRKDFNNSKNYHLHYLCSYVLKILGPIVHEMETEGETTLHVDDETIFKVCSCSNHLKILTFICKNFRGFKEECIRDVYSMLYLFYYFLFRYISKYCPNTNYAIRERIVRDVADLMLCLLMENQFLSLLLQPTIKDLKSEVKIVSWFLKLSAVQLLPYCKGRNTFCSNDDDKGCFCANSFIIICNIMEDLDTFNVEFLLVYMTVVLSEENELREITVYEFINHVLCDFASKCCPSHFNDMEKLFLKKLLTKTDNICLLVCDVWYFFCRCGPYELILKYCCFFEKLIPQVQDYTSLWIKLFVRRIIQLLPERLKLQLLDICPVLAAEIASEEYPVDYKRHFHHLLIVPCAKSLKRPNFGIFITKIKRIDNLISSQQSDEAFIRDLRIQKIFYLLELSIRMIIFCEVEEEILLQILRFAIIWNSVGVIQTGVLFILQIVKNMLLSSSNQQEFLRCLEKLFLIALDHENCIIQHQALGIFYEFSHSTPYNQVISKCINSSLYQPLVENFLKKVKGDVLLDEKDVIEAVLSQGEWLEDHKHIQFFTNVESDILYVIDSYSALNQKEIQELHFNLKTMKDAAYKLALVKQLPPWALKSIKDTCQFLHKMEE